MSDVDGFLLKHCYEPVSKVMGYILTLGKQRQCLFVTQKTKKKGKFVENNRILLLMFQSKIFYLSSQSFKTVSLLLLISTKKYLLSRPSIVNLWPKSPG